MAEGVRGVDLAGPIGRLSGLLPGSRSAVAGTAVATAWSAALTAAADDLGRRATEFVDTVRRYRDADAAVADAMAAVFRGCRSRADGRPGRSAAVGPRRAGGGRP